MLGLDLKDASQLALSLLALVFSIVAWLRKPGEDAQEALRKHVSVDHAMLRDKVLTLTERIDHMPRKEELAELEGVVKTINERTEGLSEGLSAVRTQLNRIETFLLNSK